MLSVTSRTTAATATAAVAVAVAVAVTYDIQAHRVNLIMIMSGD